MYDDHPPPTDQRAEALTILAIVGLIIAIVWAVFWAFLKSVGVI